MATGVLRLRLRACYGYGCSTATVTGVLRLWLRAYYNYGYGRTVTEATGERTGILFYCVYRMYMKVFQPNLTTMATADLDIDSTEDPSSSTDSEFEEYMAPPAGRNKIQPYRFEPTVERDDDSIAENVS